MQPTPVKNIVSEISLRKTDVFLPIFEAIINSINSILLRFPNPVSDGKIKVEIERDAKNENLIGLTPILNVTIIDNGEGFHNDNIISFETPHSHKNKELGCKGMGRFTCLAAFRSMEIESHFFDQVEWKHLAYSFDQDNEFIKSTDFVQIIEDFETRVKLKTFFNDELREASTVDLSLFADRLMNHCLIYYLDNKLPEIIIRDVTTDETIHLYEKYKELSRDRERDFEVKKTSFRAYLVRTPKRSNRKHHYVHYCANSREVGEGKSLATFNKLFTFPISRNNDYYFLDVYLVSNYLNERVNIQRNILNIPPNNDGYFETDSSISFYDIEKSLSAILEDEFQDYFKETIKRAIANVKQHIIKNGRQYKRFLNRDDLLKEIPPFADEATIEEYLHRFAYREIKSVEASLSTFIASNKIDEGAIKEISEQIKKKTAYDSDGLANYMLRRKAIIDLFDKFLEADEAGNYKLEKDIHNLIIPLGLSGEPSGAGHNLWLLDERFVSYSFVASDIPINRITQQKSRKEPDVIMWQENVDILNKPTAYGTSSSGEIKSLVVFEFKRPGETAHQRSKSDTQWRLTELVEKYFQAFIYGDAKTNYKGKTVNIEKSTPKFGYIIVDRIPAALEAYNLDMGLKKTPYGTLYDINPNLNLHIEVITFAQLVDFARLRHQPFFDKLFAD
jgi:hypothetical protein